MKDLRQSSRYEAHLLLGTKYYGLIVCFSLLLDVHKCILMLFVVSQDNEITLKHPYRALLSVAGGTFIYFVREPVCAQKVVFNDMIIRATGEMREVVARHISIY